MVIKNCEICGTEYRIKKSHAHLRRTCSRKCAAKMKSIEKSGENHPGWKGGIEKHNEGYILVYDKGNGYKNKIFAHRKIMEEHLGRKLESSELVHHIDGNKYNNAIENLKLMTRAEHMNFHREALNKNKIYKPNSGSFKKGHISQRWKVKNDKDNVQRNDSGR